MKDPRIIVLALVCFFMGWIAWVVNAYNVDAQPQTREIKLSDGTPCVINKNGGIACNWRNNK